MRWDDEKMWRNKDLQKRRCMYLRGRKCDNEEILKSENKKIRRYGKYEGNIFYRAEILESTLYLYSYVKKYIFRNYLCIEVFYIGTNFLYKIFFL